MTHANKPFAHLHVHSEFSLLDGLSRINDLAARAQELEMPALALTDHGAMYGVMQFYRACKTAGIKPIIGLETYLSARTMQDKDPQLDKNRFHMLLLAQNQTGYLNLLKIASAAQLEGFYYKPRIDRPFMARHAEGLVATTGCMAGEITRALGDGRTQQAHALMGEYLDIFGKERFYIELQEHSIPELTVINKQLMEMAPRYGLQNNFLLTNDVHYVNAADAGPHEVLLCIQTGSTVQKPKLTFSDKGYYLKSYDEMRQLFSAYPAEIVLNGLQNSLLIAEQCAVGLDDSSYHLPDFAVPAGYEPPAYLRELCEQGLRWRYGDNRAENDAELRARLDFELGVISRMGFDTYFLIVWDLCEWAVRSDRWWERHQDPFPYDSYSDWKVNDIWWNTRGSAAGSVVAYSLGITGIDPLENALIFERFLNPGRVSMPDIDLDYPDDLRPQMVAYTKRRYGSEKVAQIITFGTMGARAAIRDVGRAMDMPLPEVDAVARLIPAIPGKPAHITDVLTNGHEFYSSELEERYKRETAVQTLLDAARTLEGVTRHASSHAAGVIISDRPLHEYVPLNRPTSGDEGLGGLDRVTQWPMEIVESIGLLKVDFLGLSTLTVMRRAARLIEERYGVKYTMDNIPYDEGHVGPDPDKKPEALFDLLERGQVAGIFQVEGAGMRRLMMDMKPRRFDHIVAAISLYRPGPMENIPTYIERMHGHEVVQFHHPALESILGDTYGICVSGDALVMDARTGRRCRLDEVSDFDDFVIQGVDEEWRPAVGRVTRWIDNGRKPVYRVLLRNGMEIKVTADHQLLTEEGWQPLHDLQVGAYIGTPPYLIGEDVFVGAGQAGHDLRHSPNTHSRLSRPETAVQGARRRGYKALSYSDIYPAPSRPYVTPLPGIASLPPVARNDRAKNVVWEEIVAIEPAGEEHVYDLTVAGLHSFVANNIIVHNCVYQEQIIQIASKLAGYEPGEADMIRKAVAKKKQDLMEKHRLQFTKGAMANGYSQEVCDAIWGDIEFFARYGFPKGHAASYGKITCQTAFLKAHYPVEYLTAMLSVERDNTEKVRRYFAEAKSLGIDVGPPDLNQSHLDFTIDDSGERPLIRFGLGAIKNAGEGAINSVIEEREANGRFASLRDLCERVDLRRVGKRALEYMIKAHVFDCWGTPAQMMDALDRMVGYSSSEHAAASTGQMSLFGGATGVPALKVAIDLLHPPEKIEPVEHKTVLEWEKEALGVHVSEHPLERPLAQLQQLTTGSISEIDENWYGKPAKLAGMISQLRTLTTKKGDPMAFGTLEDLTGRIEIVFFPRTWAEVRGDVAIDQVMLVTGKIQGPEEGRGDQIKVLADNVDINPILSSASEETAYRAAPPWTPDDVFLEADDDNGIDDEPVGATTAAAAPFQPTIQPVRAAPPQPTVQPVSPAPPPENGRTTSYQPPPPPPNFFEEEMAAYRPATKPTAPSAGHGNGQARPARRHAEVAVIMRPHASWQETCRQAVELAERYRGQHSLILVIAEQKLRMAFPNHRVDASPELLDALEGLAGVTAVEMT